MNKRFIPVSVPFGLSRLPHEVPDLCGLEVRREKESQQRPKLRDSKRRRRWWRRKRQLEWSLALSSASSRWRRRLLLACCCCCYCYSDSATAAAASSSSRRTNSRRDRPWRRSLRSTFGRERRRERSERAGVGERGTRSSLDSGEKNLWRHSFFSFFCTHVIVLSIKPTCAFFSVVGARRARDRERR